MTETFVIQSDIANLPQVEERLFHFCHEHNLGSYYSTISVAVLQAAENAIVHGNGSDTRKQVALTFGTCQGGVFAEVSDEGQGFNYEQFGELPSDGQSIGEGIFVMRRLSDRMSYSEGGRKVRLEFEVNGIDPGEALERISILQEHFAMVAA